MGAGDQLRYFLNFPTLSALSMLTGTIVSSSHLTPTTLLNLVLPASFRSETTGRYFFTRVSEVPLKFYPINDKAKQHSSSSRSCTGCAKIGDGTSWCPSRVNDDGSYAWGSFGTCNCSRALGSIGVEPAKVGGSERYPAVNIVLVGIAAAVCFVVLFIVGFGSQLASFKRRNPLHCGKWQPLPAPWSPSALGTAPVSENAKEDDPLLVANHPTPAVRPITEVSNSSLSVADMKTTHNLDEETLGVRLIRNIGVMSTMLRGLADSVRWFDAPERQQVLPYTSVTYYNVAFEKLG